MKVTALLLIAIVCVSSSTVYKRLGKTQSMAALAQVSPGFKTREWFVRNSLESD